MDRKIVLVACSSQSPQSSFSRYRQDRVLKLLRHLNPHQFTQSTSVHFVFVDPLNSNRLQKRHPKHVVKTLLPYLEMVQPGSFDAILLMGCNRIAWLLEEEEYTPQQARTILLKSLAPGGLVVTFESNRVALPTNPINRNTTGGGLVVQNFKNIHTYRIRSHAYINTLQNVENIKVVFNSRYWTPLLPGVVKKKKNTPPTVKRGLSRLKRAPTGYGY